MAIQPDQTDRFYFTLPSPLVFQLTGKDVTRYLNARLSNNVRDLPPMRGCAAAALNPQGRTELFAQILKKSAEEFYVICDGGDAGQVQASLLRYKVADRVECTLRSDLALLHLSPAAIALAPTLALPPSDAAEFSFTFSSNVLVTLHSRTPLRGFDVIASATEIDSVTAALRSAGVEELSVQQQLAWRVKAHRPAFPVELNDSGIFLESGLGHAVSFTKGCYVGQEVIEKVDSHGRLPYSIVSIASVDAGEVPPRETAVEARGAQIGEILSAAQDRDGRVYSFARIKTALLATENSFTVSGKEFRIV